MTIAIIQARMASKRLPGKAMLPLLGRPLISRVITRGKMICGVGEVVLATSLGSENDILAGIARYDSIDAFRGDEENVLERFHSIAVKKSANHIVRLTGDNPLHDPGVISALLKRHIEQENDYTSVSGLPAGVGADIFSMKALELSMQSGNGRKMADSVDLFVLENPSLFRIEELVVTPSLSSYRFSIDTREDYDRMKKLFDTIGEEIMILDLPALLDAIDTAGLSELMKPKNPEVSMINIRSQELLQSIGSRTHVSLSEVVGAGL